MSSTSAPRAARKRAEAQPVADNVGAVLVVMEREQKMLDIDLRATQCVRRTQRSHEHASRVRVEPDRRGARLLLTGAGESHQTSAHAVGCDPLRLRIVTATNGTSP